MGENITVYLDHCSKYCECPLLNPLKGAMTELYSKLTVNLPVDSVTQSFPLKDIIGV